MSVAEIIITSWDVAKGMNIRACGKHSIQDRDRAEERGTNGELHKSKTKLRTPYTQKILS